MQIIEQNLILINVIQVQSHTCSNYTYFGNITLIAGSLNILLWNRCNMCLSIAFSVEKIKQMTDGAISVKKTGMRSNIAIYGQKDRRRLSGMIFSRKDGHAGCDLSLYT